MLTHEEPELDIADITIVDPDNTFYMRMGNDVMSGHCIRKDHVLVIDRTLTPVSGSIVAFFHEGDFYVREYSPQTGAIQLKADTPADTITIAASEPWICWGVVLLSINPLLQTQHRIGRYARVCAC